MKYILLSLVLIFIGCGGSSEKKELGKAEIVNGFHIPPEPDPKINNATLLGVDSNNNGIRDDVERYIVKELGKKIKKAEIPIYLLEAKNEQKKLALKDLSKKSIRELDKTFLIYDGCIDYLGDIKLINDRDFIQFAYREEEAKIYNTKERLKRREIYEQGLSGGVYFTPIEYIKKESCEKLGIDIKKIKESK